MLSHHPRSPRLAEPNNPTEGAKWIVGHAFGISDTGWITGGGVYDSDGAGGIAAAQRAYLLDASSLVPEPSSLALFSFDVLALLRLRRFRAEAAELLGIDRTHKGTE
jgi:hypothetical protein